MLENPIQGISDALTQLCRHMAETVVPSLKSIQDNQTEQRQQTDWLNENIEEFRIEMQTRFAELHAEIAACRLQINDALTVLREERASGAQGRKSLIH